MAEFKSLVEGIQMNRSKVHCPLPPFPLVLNDAKKLEVCCAMDGFRNFVVSELALLNPATRAAIVDWVKETLHLDLDLVPTVCRVDMDDNELNMFMSKAITLKNGYDKIASMVNSPDVPVITTLSFRFNFLTAVLIMLDGLTKTLTRLGAQ